MTQYPHLSLAHIEIDAELVRRLPRKLAYYHLALPLATDGDQVSLAMAHPENTVVLKMLETVLGQPIVPVHGSPGEIREVLDRVWQVAEKPAPHLLSWGSTPELAAIAQRMAETLSHIFAAQIMERQPDSLDTLLLLTQQDTYVLTVVNTAPTEDLIGFIRQAATPVLMLYGDVRPFRRMLLSLRGHSPDLSALGWVLPLATTYSMEMTVLAVTAASATSTTSTASRPTRQPARTARSLRALLDPSEEPAQHLAECVERIADAGLSGYLKLCQGDPVQEIATEFTKRDYDLLVVVLEAHGDFVQQVIEAVKMQAAGRAILVVKPTLT